MPCRGAEQWVWGSGKTTLKSRGTENMGKVSSEQHLTVPAFGSSPRQGGRTPPPFLASMGLQVWLKEALRASSAHHSPRETCGSGVCTPALRASLAPLWAPCPRPVFISEGGRTLCLSPTALAPLARSSNFQQTKQPKAKGWLHEMRSSDGKGSTRDGGGLGHETRT